MAIQGGCYCGAVRYEVEGDAMMKGQCFCRECQHNTGGGAAYIMGVPEAGFTYTQGSPKAFSRSDLENAVTREFCGDCGAPLATRAPGMAGAVMIKVGSLDDPGSVFGQPQMVIFTSEMQPYHQLPEGIPNFPGFPG
ncbi:GFA family protein [Myxococcota bacterium]|nr:GFA family protein [Myxococcota bacterium]